MADITTLINFNFPNGEYPVGSLVEDAAGDLFGTAVAPPGTESVFEIANTPLGYASAPTILATFDDTSSDATALTINAAGDLFVDGLNDNPNVYEIAKSAGGYGAAALLADVGGEPAGSLVTADSGDLIGVTAPDSSGGDINVFEIAASGSGYASDASTIGAIALPVDDQLSGQNSLLLARDAAGDLFVAFSSGPFVGGTVVIDEIAKTPTGYAAPQTLGSFGVTYGQLDSLLVDAAGNVFAGVGGYSSAIVEIAKTGGGYATTPTYVDDNMPAGLVGNLVEDADGNLFAATEYAYYGGSGYGEVFMEAPSSGGQYSSQIVAQFDDALGGFPTGLLLGPGGDLYGTTPRTGTTLGGTLFRVDLEPQPVVSITLVSAFQGVLELSGSIDSADAALPVSIYDGDDLLGTATPAAGGFWSFSDLITAPSGESDFEAVATNASGGMGSTNAILFYDTNNNWGVNSGAQGTVYLVNAEASITAGGASVYLNGPNDAVSLYNTSGNWDTVTGDYGVVILTSSQASIVGGGDAIYFAGLSGNAVSLYYTFDEWDKATGDDASLTLVHAQVSVFGGYDTIYLDGSTDDAASLYATNNHWDTVYGGYGAVTLNNAQASVLGEGDYVYFSPGTSNQVSLYDTHGVSDVVTGSNGFVTFTDAQAAVYGGSNVLYFVGQDDAADLYATSGAWDTVSAEGGSVTLHGAQVSVWGSDDQIVFAAGANNAASLYTDGAWDTVTGDDGAVTLSGARASVLGGGDYIYFTAGIANGVSLYQTNGVDDYVFGSNGAINLTNAQASLNGSGDTFYSSGVSAADVASGGDETFAFAAAIGEATIGGFASSDVVQFSAADFNNYQALSGHIAQSGDDVVITYDANDKVTLTNYSASSLTSANFKLA